MVSSGNMANSNWDHSKVHLQRMTYKDLGMKYHRRELRACLSPALNVRGIVKAKQTPS